MTAGSTRRRVNINNLAFKIRFFINTVYVRRHENNFENKRVVYYIMKMR
jgi:hypothetical protein